jgi:hypothetical protein
VPAPPLRALIVGCTAAGLLLTGCGGGGGGKGAKQSPPAPVAPSATSAAAPPSHAPERVKSALLSAGEIASRVRAQPLTVEGLKQKAVPVCADSYTTLPGTPEIVARQFGPAGRYLGANYAQVAAIYQDAESATKAFSVVRQKATACKSKRHVPPRKVKGTKITTLAYDATWKQTVDTISGWTHIRGAEKRTYSPSLSTINVIYEDYDYAVQGNVVIAALYWERVKPTAAAGPIASRATKLLTKQLRKIT